MFLSTSKPRIFSALGNDTSPPDSEKTVAKYAVKVNASRSRDLQDTASPMRSTYRKKLHFLTGAQWTQGPEIHLQQEVSRSPTTSQHTRPDNNSFPTDCEKASLC